MVLALVPGVEFGYGKMLPECLRIVNYSITNSVELVYMVQTAPPN